MDTILSRSRLKTSLEVIAFQNDDFKDELVSFFRQLRDKGSSYYKQGGKDLEKLLFDRFGLKFKVVTNGMLGAIMPFYVNKNHIFLKNFLRGDFSISDQEKILKEAQNKTGWVDTKRARVGGLFSEHVNTLWLNFYQLIHGYKLSDAEMASVCLHEVGHAFYACEYADRLESMNQVLAEIARIKANVDDKKRTTYVYHEVKKINKDMTEEDVELLLSDNHVIAGAKWFKMVVGAVKTQMSDVKYDETAFEQLADNFASRMGLGKELIVALDKLHVLMASPERNIATRMLLTFWDVMLFVMLAAGVFLGSGFLVAFGGIMVILQFLLTGEATRDYTYDELKTRYTRIRHQLIEQLKKADATNEERLAVLEELDTIDLVIEKAVPYKSFYGKIADWLLPSNWRAKASIKEQQLLEEMANNDLFVQAAKLRTV